MRGGIERESGAGWGEGGRGYGRELGSSRRGLIPSAVMG